MTDQTETECNVCGYPIADIRALEAKVRGMDEAVEWLERDRDLWHQRAKINEDRADKYAAHSAYLMPALAEAHKRIGADRDRLAGEVERLRKEQPTREDVDDITEAGRLMASAAKKIMALSAEVARLIAELAEAREEIARRDAEFNEPGRWGVCGSDLGDGTTCQTIVQRWTAGDLERAATKAAELHEAVFGDAARRAGEGEK